MPKPDNLMPPWKPGESGNPGGYSRGRRIRDAIRRLIDRHSLDDDVALVLIAMALGRADLLGDRTGDPDLGWWRELAGRLDADEELGAIWAELESLRSARSGVGGDRPGTGPAPPPGA